VPVGEVDLEPHLVANMRGYAVFAVIADKLHSISREHLTIVVMN